MGSLGELRWRRWRLTLRNTRNLLGRTPPLVAFEAIFKFGARRGHFPPTEAWCFHALDGPPGARVRLGREHALAVVFPTAGEEAVRGFLAGVAEHLALPEHNFALVSGPVEERHLAALAAERPDLEAAGDEVCLEFQTPYEIARRDAARPWHVTAEDFFAALVARLRRLFGPGAPAPPAEAVAAATLLPCCWHYEEHRHRSRSGAGTHFLKGWRGPLYLRGPVAPLLPWLRLAGELHAADPATFGRAHAVLRLGRPHFDAALRNPAVWRAAYEELAAQATEPEPFFVPLAAGADPAEGAEPSDPAQANEDEDEDEDEQEQGPEQGRGEGLPGPLAELLADIRAGRWRPRPARAFAVPKKTGGERLAVRLAGPDRLVHRVLHRVLAPALDRLLEDAACGFRPGRGVGDARRAIARAWKEGCTWVLEADIAAFFDSVPWARLHAKLDAVLPRADAWARALLAAAVETPAERAGAPVARTQGLLQGSPLSPLLANLYLDEFDERAARAGLRLVRYADDFVVLCRSQAEAEQARATVAALLAELGLELQADKTALTPAEAGFTFLGMELGADLEEAVVEASTLRKTVWVREPGAWLALDAD
jgi:CRISPR-associated protein Cas1